MRDAKKQHERMLEGGGESLRCANGPFEIRLIAAFSGVACVAAAVALGPLSAGARTHRRHSARSHAAEGLGARAAGAHKI